MVGSCFCKPLLFLVLCRGSGLTGSVRGAIIGLTSAVVDGFRNEPDRKVRLAVSLLRLPRAAAYVR